jgi:alkanesulfonate monooxygenase SsuD/methylene tetrahydromethanopterin reductase-like flavin-dependent oxidoreductase (luciferase family)
MDIGLLMAIRRLPDSGEPLDEVYESYIGDAVHAEQLGFDSVWTGEHHFSSDAWAPSQFPVLAAMAQRTSRVRLGSCILLTPLHNPLRIAEDAATVDILSRGRLELGFGAGSAPDEFDTYGVAWAQRFSRTHESIQFVRRAYAEERFDHTGKHFTFPNVRMTTRPIQDPLPMWLACGGPKMVRWAGRNGCHLALVAPPDLLRSYDEALAEGGHDPARFKVATPPLWVHVAKTRDQAWEEAEEGLRHVLMFYGEKNPQQPAIWAEGVLESVPPLGEFRNVPGIGFGAPFIAGTPDEVLARLEPFVGTRFSHLIMTMRQAGMGDDAARRSMDLFADKVMPRLR